MRAAHRLGEMKPLGQNKAELQKGQSRLFVLDPFRQGRHVGFLGQQAADLADCPAFCTVQYVPDKALIDLEFRVRHNDNLFE